MHTFVPHASDINVAATLDTHLAVWRDFSDMIASGVVLDTGESALGHYEQ